MKTPKLPRADVIAEVRRLVNQPGLFLFDGHALVRMAERGISTESVAHVLRTGYHAEKRDRFNSRLPAWTYAIEGVTAAGQRLRVAIAFVMHEPVPDHMLMVITAIGLD